MVLLNLFKYVFVVSVILALSMIGTNVLGANYSYDELNRLKSVQYSDGSAIIYSYDEIGNLLSKSALTPEQNPPPITTASIPGGLFNQPQSVSLDCVDSVGDPCRNIFYTTDGSTPTFLSRAYDSPLSIQSYTILKFFGVSTLGRAETPKSHDYIVDMVSPATEAMPSGGVYNSAKSVALTCYDTGGAGCDKIYYTVDGSTPSTASPVYLTTLSISASTALKFFAMDKAGNSEEVRNEVYTFDTTPPTGSIAINADTASTNSLPVTLTLSATDVNAVTNMQFSWDGTTWYAWETYATTRSATIPNGADGTKTIYVKYRDSVGNVSAVYTDSIELDRVAPTATITINGGAATTNNTVATLNLTCSDTSGCSQMQFSNDNVTWSIAETYAAIKSWPLTPGAGIKTVYAKFKDNAGNWTTALNDTIVLDVTAPTGSIAINAGAASTNSLPVTLTLSAADATAVTNMQFSWDGTTWYGWEPYATTRSATIPDCADGTKTIYVKYRDSAGNVSAVYTDSIVLDRAAPTATITINGGTAATNSTAVTLNLTCSDASGCSQMQFSNDNVTWSAAETYATIKSWPLTSGAGTKTVYAKFKDNAGNWTTALNDTILFDPNPPSGTISINGGAGATNSTAATLNLTCSDASGCSQMQFSNDNVTWSAAETYAIVKSWSLTTGAGTKTVYAKFKDNAGNWTTALNDTIVLDVTAPTGTIAINAGAHAVNDIAVTLNLACNDSSGCSQMQFSNDNVTWSTAEPYAATKSWTVGAGDGTKTVYVKFKDVAANWSIVFSDYIYFDTVAPTTVASVDDGVYNNAVQVMLTCNDTYGCNSTYYTLDGSTPTSSSNVYVSPIVISNNSVLKYFSKDHAGNSEGVSSRNYTIVTNPGVEFTNTVVTGQDYFEILYDRINSQDFDFNNTQTISVDGLTFSPQHTFECIPNIYFYIEGNSRMTVSCGTVFTTNIINAVVTKSGDTTLYYGGYMRGNGNKLEFYNGGVLIGTLAFVKSVQ